MRTAKTIAQRAVQRPVAARRNPRGQRAQATVERMHAAAEQLLTTGGLPALKMRKVAELSGASIGSVYQYFPNREALLASLVRKFFSRFRGAFILFFKDIDGLDQFVDAAATAVDAYHRMLREAPVVLELWGGTQGWEPLRQMDAMDSRENAEIMAGVLRRLLPTVDAREITACCLMLNDMAGSVTRLAISAGGEMEERLMRQLKDAIIAHIFGIAQQRRSASQRRSGQASGSRSTQ